jgi:membrane protease YdiL (CAAX protease family)
MVIIAMYGCLLGALAYWRRSVRPGMIAHFMQDGLVGLLAPYLFR